MRGNVTVCHIKCCAVNFVVQNNMQDTVKISTKPQACNGLLIVEQPLTSLRQMQTKCLHSLSGHRNRVVRQSIMNNHLLEVLNGKIMYENFNLGKPPPTPPPPPYPICRQSPVHTPWMLHKVIPTSTLRARLSKSTSRRLAVIMGS
jgi:hypothetical protein